MRALFWTFFAILLIVRLPSLAQPAGADQGLYAYVGQRILAGDVPYRDAWDQKPPGVHYTYAVMYAIWRNEAVVVATDLVVAALAALVILTLGRRLGGPGAGELAALLFLLYSNPALARLGGVRVRAQCEVFIALAVSAAFLVLHRTLAAPASRARAWIVLSGLLFGVAFIYKYNAGAYLAVGALALVLWRTDESHSSPLRSLIDYGPPLVGGFLLAALLMLSVFAWRGALVDLYQATITYNLLYSGETYASRLQMLRYLVTFPVQHARVDALWFLGGLGTVAMLWVSRRQRAWLIVPLWIAAGCLSIAVNSGRGLPQYFLQLNPALTLAAGIGGVAVWQRVRPAWRLVGCLVLALATWRVMDFQKAIDYTAHDLAYWRGTLSREHYLSRFGGQDDKYSALAVHDLAAYLSRHTTPSDTALVFGFSPGALVQANRRSASRFFWSRPLIVGFLEGTPGYGVTGLLQELDASKPAVVALQQQDWALEGTDSATFFLSQASLKQWLGDRYRPAGKVANFLIYERIRS